MESEDGSKNLSQEHKSEDEDAVGAGGKGRKKSSSSKKPSSSSSAEASTKRFTPSDMEWAKDLPSDFTHNHKDWCQYLSAAIKQGKLMAFARCIQALFAINGTRVQLSPQHLINNISNSEKNGQIHKFEELSDFLKNQGLVLEEVCKFSGLINETCPKECSNQTSDGPVYKIQEFTRMKRKEVKEENLIQLVNKRPIVAIVDSYQSFWEYKSGIYKGTTKRKDDYLGRHAVLVVGFGTTDEGEHYWLIQNSYGDGWGDKGFAKIIRKCSQRNGEPSLFVNAFDIVV